MRFCFVILSVSSISIKAQDPGEGVKVPGGGVGHLLFPGMLEVVWVCESFIPACFEACLFFCYGGVFPSSDKHLLIICISEAFKGVQQLVLHIQKEC